jgi:hypothetical protein
MGREGLSIRWSQGLLKHRFQQDPKEERGRTAAVLEQNVSVVKASLGTSNPSYLGDRDQEDHSLKLFKNTHHKKGLVEWLKVKALSSSPGATHTHTHTHTKSLGTVWHLVCHCLEACTEGFCKGWNVLNRVLVLGRDFQKARGEARMGKELGSLLSSMGWLQLRSVPARGEFHSPIGFADDWSSGV